MTTNMASNMHSLFYYKQQSKAYLCFQPLGFSNAHFSLPFTKVFIEKPQFKHKVGIKAVSLNALFKEAFSVLKEDQHTGIRVERPMRITDLRWKQQNLALKCLTDFLKDYKTHEQNLVTVSEKEGLTESMECAALAVHLFSKLIPGGLEDVVVKGMKGNIRKCPCGCETKIRLGNTGIGDPHVWHGFPDMLVQQTAISLKSHSELDVDEDVEEDSDHVEHGDSPAKKMKFSESEDTEDICNTMKIKRKTQDVYDFEFSCQVLGQCLTNGFAQKSKLHFSNNLVPSIGCTLKRMLIYLYDPDNDILLRNQVVLTLIDENSLVLDAVVELWFVLNLHVFGASISEEVAGQLYACGFKDFLEEKGVKGFYEKALVAVEPGKLIGNVPIEDPLALIRSTIDYSLL